MSLKAILLVFLVIFEGFPSVGSSSIKLSSSSSSEEQADVVKDKCPQNLDSQRLTAKDLSLLLGICGSPDSRLKATSLQAYELILNYKKIFKDAHSCIKAVEWKSVDGIEASSASMAWGQLKTHLETKMSSSDTVKRGWERIAPILEHLAFGKPRRFLTLLSSCLNRLKKSHGRGKRLTRSLEEAITDKQFFDTTLVVNAFRVWPGHETLMLLGQEGLVIDTSTEPKELKLIDRVLLAAKKMAKSKESSISREILVENMVESIRSLNKGAQPYIGLSKLLLEYTVEELKQIMTQWHQPHLKSLLVMGKSIFNAAELSKQQPIDPLAVLQRLKTLLVSQPFAKKKLPSLVAFFSNTKLATDDLDRLSETLFRHCSRHRLQPTCYRDWEALQWTLATEKLLTLSLSDHLHSVLGWFSEESFPHAPLLEAYTSKLAKWTTSYSDSENAKAFQEWLFKIWRHVRDRVDSGYMLQPLIHDPTSLTAAFWQTRPSEAYKSLLAGLHNFLEEKPDYSPQLKVAIHKLERENSDVLTLLFHQLYKHMKRPINNKDTGAAVEKYLLQTPIMLELQCGLIKRNRPAASKILAEFVPPPNVASIKQLEDAADKFIKARSGSKK